MLLQDRAKKFDIKKDIQKRQNVPDYRVAYFSKMVI